MKKLTHTLIALSLLVLTLCLLTACGEKLPADFAKGEDVKIDNETPFVYDESSVQTVTVKSAFTGKPEERSLDEFVRAWTDDEEAIPYSRIAGYFGNKIVRHFTADGKDSYYTVYSLPDNQIFYLFLCMKDGVLYLDQEYYLYNSAWPIDIRDEYAYTMTEYIYEQDLPSAILGDKLPSYCYLDYYTPEEIERRNNLEWEFYSSGCDRAGVTSDPFVSDFYCELYAEGRHKEVEGAIRCIQDVAFDTVVEDPENEDYTVHHGSYYYDIYVFTDGTGILFFTHYNTDAYPRYTAWQKEEISLSVAEVAKLQTLLNDWDFKSIPTWNPEEFSGFDGETTTVFTKGLGHNNLTSMWSASKRDAVYHIREAIEEIVRAHVTVEQGRIYRSDLYEEYEWMQD